MKRPPYDRRARDRLSAPMRGRVPAFGTLLVHAGEGAWDACREDTRAAVLLPPDQWPEGFDWSLCTLAVPPVLLLGWQASDEVLARTARAMIRDGAARVLILPGNRQPWALFKAKEAAHAA